MWLPHSNEMWIRKTIKEWAKKERESIKGGEIYLEWKIDGKLISKTGSLQSDIDDQSIQVALTMRNQ